MKPKNDLFELIHTLTANEKRYFRLYASMQKGNKIYTRLFNEISNQHYYDEEKIKVKFKGEKFIEQLGFTKNYLMKLIFKALASFKHESSAEMKIQHAIVKCKILFSKSLYKQYFKALQSAKELALKYERFGYYIELLEMEKLIAKKTEVGKKDITAVYTKADEALKSIKSGFDASKIVAGCYNLSRTKGKVRGDEQQTEIDELLLKINSSLQNNSRTARSKESLYNAASILYNVNCDYEERIKFLLNRLKVIEESPEPFTDCIIDYIYDILSELSLTYLKLNRTVEARKYLELYEQKEIQQYGKIDSVFIVPAFIRMLIFIKNRDTRNIMLQAGKLEQGLVFYKDKMDISFELDVNYHLIVGYIICKDFNNALRRTNFLLSHPLIYVRSDLECFARIMNLIIHFELNNIQLLEYLIVSTYRYLYKREKMFLIESYILNFLKKLGSVNNNAELLELLEIQKLSMKKLMNDKYEKNAFEYFDFISWIDDKIGKLKN